MNLRDLHYLVALAEHRHFGRAADACFVSQPTLSTQIKKLKGELGVKLVERTPGKILLTATGREIIRRARAVLAEADEIKAIAQRARDPEAGTLRLGIFPTLAPYLLPHVVPLLRERFPRLELLLTEEKTEHVLRMLREGALDAGIVAMPVHEDSLHSEFLFEEPFVLAVPGSHPLAARKSRLKLSDLENEHLLLLEDGHCLRDQALEVCQLAGAGEKTGFRATSLETLRQMVAANVGITLLPTLAIKPPIGRTDNVRLLEFAGHAPNRRIAMVWRKSTSMTTFLQRLAKVFHDLPAELFVPGLGPDKPATHTRAVKRRA